MLIAWPKSTIIVLVGLWGVWALADGIGLGVQAFSKDAGTNQRVRFGAMAHIAVVVALIAFTRPGLTAAALTWTLGIWLIVRSVFEVVGALTATLATPRWLLLLGAGIDLLLGILFVANPGRSAVAIAVVLGIAAVVWGAVFVALAFIARSAAHEVGDGPQVASTVA